MSEYIMKIDNYTPISYSYNGIDWKGIKNKELDEELIESNNVVWNGNQWIVVSKKNFIVKVGNADTGNADTGKKFIINKSPNPTLYMKKGEEYTFILDDSSNNKFPFFLSNQEEETETELECSLILKEVSPWHFNNNNKYDEFKTDISSNIDNSNITKDNVVIYDTNIYDISYTLVNFRIVDIFDGAVDNEIMNQIKNTLNGLTSLSNIGEVDHEEGYVSRAIIPPLYNGNDISMNFQFDGTNIVLDRNKLQTYINEMRASTSKKRRLIVKSNINDDIKYYTSNKSLLNYEGNIKNANDVSGINIYSNDGITWFKNETDVSGVGTCIAYNKRTPYVNIKQPMIILGESFNKSDNNKLVQNHNTMFYSENGTYWQGLGANIFKKRANNAKWNGSIWVAVGDSSGNSDGYTIAYSYDGKNWTGVVDDAFDDRGNNVFWDGKQWVAFGKGSLYHNIATSKDGIKWNLKNSSEFDEIFTAAWDSSNNIWIAIGEKTNTAVVAYSTSLTDWDTIDTFSNFETVSDIAFNGKYWVIIGVKNSNAYYVYSDDPLSLPQLGKNIWHVLTVNNHSKNKKPNSIIWKYPYWVVSFKEYKKLLYFDNNFDAIVGEETNLLELPSSLYHISANYTVKWDGEMWIATGVFDQAFYTSGKRTLTTSCVAISYDEDIRDTSWNIYEITSDTSGGDILPRGNSIGISSTGINGVTLVNNGIVIGKDSSSKLTVEGPSTNYQESNFSATFNIENI